MISFFDGQTESRNLKSGFHDLNKDFSMQTMNICHCEKKR